MKKITIITALFAPMLGIAQSPMWNFGLLSTNDVQVRVNANGLVGFDGLSTTSCSIPASTVADEQFMFASHLWIGGIDASGSLRTAGQMYYQDGFDFLHGPTWGDSSIYNTDWAKVWSISKADIQQFQTDLANGIASPSNNPSIFEWPAVFTNPNTGQIEFIAPFEDHNNNPLDYNPLAGDLPIFKGDKALFFVFSDRNVALPRETFGSSSLGVECHGMLYAFESCDDTVNKTIFLNYKIINKSNNLYSDFYVGNFMDPDLGNGADDYIGTDTSLNMVFAYNSSNYDSGFETNPPAYGFVYLNKTLSNSISFNNDFSVTGNPEYQEHFYNYLESKWKDGSLLAENTINGYDPNSSNHSSYVFNSGVGLNGWKESDTGGDRRIVMSHGAFNFFPQDTFELDMAWIYARSGDHLQNVAALGNVRNHIQGFYEGTIFCDSVSRISTPALADFRIYPNPAQDEITLQMGLLRASTLEIKVLDMMGKELFATQLKDKFGMVEESLDLSAIPSGIYFISVNTGQGIVTQKLILE